MSSAVLLESAPASSGNATNCIVVLPPAEASILTYVHIFVGRIAQEVHGERREVQVELDRNGTSEVHLFITNMKAGERERVVAALRAGGYRPQE